MSDSFAIGYCHGGRVHAWFHTSVLQMILHDITHERRWRGEISQEGLYVAWSRNKIVQRFLTTPVPVDWLLMVDTDMTFQPETAYALIESAREVGAKIMSAWYCGYCSTEAPGQLLTVWFEDGAESKFKTPTHIDLDKPQKLAAVGMGCCVIHRDVLVEMAMELGDEWPWFQHDLAMDRGIQRQMGEDMSFCARARKVGFETWGDSRIRCGHLKQRVENWETFLEAEAKRNAD